MRESQTVLKWQREAIVETLQRMLKRLLDKRFGPLPLAVVEQIDGILDPDRLENAIDQIDTLGRIEDLSL